MITPTDGGPEPAHDDGPGGTLFWAATVVGGLTVLFALRQLWLASSSRSRGSIVRFLVGAGVAHDAIWAPAVVVVGLLTARLLPLWARRPVRLGLAFTALLVLVSGAQVAGFGARPGNPSLLPLDYGRSLLVLVGLVWIAAGIGLVVGFRRRSAS